MPEIVNRDLWVVVEGSDARAYLLENSHTFPGRMYATYEGADVGFSVSKNDIVDASPLARVWIDGFLRGNEPSLGDFMGVDEDTADLEANSNEPVLDRWRTALAAFNDNGYMPILNRRPTLAIDSEVEVVTPWVAAGGEVWEWQTSRWVRAEPQPKLASGWSFIEGTLCSEREAHETVEHDVHHLICTDCGHTTEVE